MEQNLNIELKQITSELQEIISVMERISGGIRSDFRGIGSEYCASCLNNVAKEFRTTAKNIEQTKAAVPPQGIHFI